MGTASLGPDVASGIPLTMRCTGWEIPSAPQRPAGRTIALQWLYDHPVPCGGRRRRENPLLIYEGSPTVDEALVWQRFQPQVPRRLAVGLKSDTWAAWERVSMWDGGAVHPRHL